MKNAIKVLIFTVAFIALAAGAIFGAIKYNQLDFSLIDGDEAKTASITAYSGSSLNIEIPKKIHGKTITVIEKGAFADKAITSVVIPDTVEYIENGAFEACTKLEKVTIGSSVKVVGEKAFAGCVKLSEINFPAKLKSIGTLAFSRCDALKDIKIDDGADFAIENSVVYNKDKTKAIFALNDADFSNFKFPATLKEIPESFFYGNDDLTSFEIPEGIKNIPDSLFAMCSNLKSVKIPDSVIRIGNSAFFGCTSLDKLSVPNSVMNFDKYCFPVSLKNNDSASGSKIFNKNFTLVVGKDSAAQRYAEANNIKYEIAK
ncbi:MAG: leucine-rich repeat domain-containing protein [Clostridia bacterium]|nr:leucine-rich repeat domain-containing protein [Clostridia bacterium]